MPTASRAGRDPAVQVARDGGVAWIRIAAPAGPGGRLSARVHSELCAGVDDLDHDDGLRVAIVDWPRAGRGEAPHAAPAARASASGDGVAAIARLRVPVIALLRGDVLDDALELALACDLRVAAVDARLGLTQVARGEFPSGGGTQRLPRIVGRARATRMLLLGEIVPARTALAIGLVHEVSSARALEAAGRRLAARIAERGPIAERFAKEALGAAFDLPLAEGLRLEGDLYVLLQTTRDREEGIASFRKKRSPRFTGR